MGEEGRARTCARQRVRVCARVREYLSIGCLLSVTDVFHVLYRLHGNSFAGSGMDKDSKGQRKLDDWQRATSCSGRTQPVE